MTGPSKSEESENECFYSLCYKKEYCGERVTVGVFKNRSETIFCSVFSLMMFALFTAVIGPLMLYKLADDEINSQVVIDSPNAENYEAWQTNVEGPGTDVAITYDLYYFDLRNPEEVLLGAKPVVTEVGPYAFNEFYNKFDITWTDDGDTVEFNTQTYYVFDPERTQPGLSLDDELTLPYTTVIAFEYMFEAISANMTTMVDIAVYSALTKIEDTAAADLEKLYDAIDDKKIIPRPIKKRLEEEIKATEERLTAVFDDMREFTNQSHPKDLLLKHLLCKVPSGVSPFWKVKPDTAWFGWLNDPLLLEIQKVLDVANSLPNMTMIPWTSAVPGVGTNYTSVAETRRRRAKDTFKTGKRNTKQVDQYIKYSNMKHVWACVNSMASQDPNGYTEGEQFPACELFDENWTDEEAEAKGYVKPFETDYANRIRGTDAQMFGRPIDTEKLQVFVSDIYRSVYLEYAERHDWYGVPVRRYGFQMKDLANSTMNPENAQFDNFAPAGMSNMTRAVGAPIFASLPHFLNAQKELVADVEGMRPNPDAHLTYLEMEPQSGLLTTAQKRLQVNYQMKSTHLPEAPPNLVTDIEAVCDSWNHILEELHKHGILANIPDLCEPLAIQAYECLSQPSTWTFRSTSSPSTVKAEGSEAGNSALFMPYGWVQEAAALPEEDADSLSESLFAVDDAASELRFWCLIVAAGSLCTLIALTANTYYTVTGLMRDFEAYKASSAGGIGNHNDKYYYEDSAVSGGRMAAPWREPLLQEPPMWESNPIRESGSPASSSPMAAGRGGGGSAKKGVVPSGVNGTAGMGMGEGGGGGAVAVGGVPSAPVAGGEMTMDRSPERGDRTADGYTF